MFICIIDTHVLILGTIFGMFYDNTGCCERIGICTRPYKYEQGMSEQDKAKQKSGAYVPPPVKDDKSAERGDDSRSETDNSAVISQ